MGICATKDQKHKAKRHRKTDNPFAKKSHGKTTAEKVVDEIHEEITDVEIKVEHHEAKFEQHERREERRDHEVRK